MRSSSVILVLLLIVGVVVMGGTIGWLKTTNVARAQQEAARAEAEQAAQAAIAAEGRASVVNSELTVQVEELSARNEELVARNEELTQQTEQLNARVAELTAELAGDSPGDDLESKTREGGLPVAFGKWGELQQLLDANWKGMAGSVRRMNEMIDGLYAKILAGEEPTMEEQIAIAKENQALSQYALQVIGKLPTTSTGNGEYAHPITLSNLTAALLEEAGQPLTEAQERAMSRLGDQYEESWERLQASYEPDALALTQFIDELGLKQEFVEGARRQLSSAQLELVTPDTIADRTRMDVLSPVVMTVGLGRVVRGKDPESLKSNYVDAVSSFYGIPREQLDGMGYVFENWLAAVQPALSPTPANIADFYDLDAAVIGGRAHARVLQDLLGAANLDDATREKLRTQKLFAVPVLVQ